MRFYKPQVGDVRTRTFFALLPFGWKGEWRWLERVTVRETYFSDMYDSGWKITEINP